MSLLVLTLAVHVVITFFENEMYVHFNGTLFSHPSLQLEHVENAYPRSMAYDITICDLSFGTFEPPWKGRVE
ncbi:hypothetical protein M405DRAFT_208586 [Rhizopogon salebrosus TDB-379]|nr:hypothetical protein M405DRAFT_208586 [Rhizopogon salebrosus TDB-379]